MLASTEQHREYNGWRIQGIASGFFMIEKESFLQKEK